MSSPIKEPVGRTSTDSSSSKRRSSSGMFANLTQQKRGTEAHGNRRESLSEMGPRKGALGTMFDNIFKGSAGGAQAK